MLQRERAGNLHHLLHDRHKNKKRESSPGCGLDITPIHVDLDSSLCALFLAETAGGSFRRLRRDLRDDCTAEALLSSEFFLKSVDLVLSQRAFLGLLSVAGTARRRGFLTVPERCQASR